VEKSGEQVGGLLLVLLSEEETRPLKALPKEHPLITNAMEEMHWWACFKDDYKERQAAREKQRPPAVPEPLWPTWEVAFFHLEPPRAYT
jgi:hypothetical protein